MSWPAWPWATTSKGSTAPSTRTSRTSARSSAPIPSPPSSASDTNLSLNLRLIALVAALLAVTIGGIGVISTRVAHYEIRKIEIGIHAQAGLPAPHEEGLP